MAGRPARLGRGCERSQCPCPPAPAPPRRERLIWAERERTAGMKFKEARLENIGPIRRAAIGAHRLTVFVGPNNSGKSIASRMIHSARRLDLSAMVQVSLDDSVAPGGTGGSKDAAAARADAVLRGAGIEWPDVVTHSMHSGRLELVGGNGAGGTVLDFVPDALPDGVSLLLSLADSLLGSASEHSIYVPAGRTGTIQSLFTLMQIKNDLLNSILRTLAEGHGYNQKRVRPKTSPRLSVSRQMPEYLEQFYSIVIETFSGGFDGRTKGMFSRVFPGSIKMSKAFGLPTIIYADPLGFECRIDSAASGVASAFPIMVAVNRLEPAGMLVVEEPEEHIEPIRQIKLVGEMVRAASARDISMVITTHSPFVANAVLGLVTSGDVKPDDLGMYYFRRRRGSYTDVEKIPVNRAGEAEQELFDEAIDALAYGSVVPDAP